MRVGRRVGVLIVGRTVGEIVGNTVVAGDSMINKGGSWFVPGWRLTKIIAVITPIKQSMLIKVTTKLTFVHILYSIFELSVICVLFFINTQKYKTARALRELRLLTYSVACTLKLNANKLALKRKESELLKLEAARYQPLVEVAITNIYNGLKQSFLVRGKEVTEECIFEKLSDEVRDMLVELRLIRVRLEEKRKLVTLLKNLEVSLTQVYEASSRNWELVDLATHITYIDESLYRCKYDGIQVVLSKLTQQVERYMENTTNLKDTFDAESQEFDDAVEPITRIINEVDLLAEVRYFMPSTAKNPVHS